MIPGSRRQDTVLLKLLKKEESCEHGIVFRQVQKTPPRKGFSSIFLDFEKILQKWDAQLLILEDIFVLPRFPKAALQLGAVRGILALAAAYNNLEVMELKPTEIKAALTGNGRANKDQVEKAVRKILGIKEQIKTEHASDALALALVGLSRANAVQW